MCVSSPPVSTVSKPETLSHQARKALRVEFRVLKVFGYYAPAISGTSARSAETAICLEPQQVRHAPRTRAKVSQRPPTCFSTSLKPWLILHCLYPLGLSFVQVGVKLLCSGDAVWSLGVTDS